MALKVDWSGIKDYESVTVLEQDGKKITHPITNTLSLGMIAVGLPEYTAKNIDEVIYRYNIQQKIFGGWGPGGMFLSEDDIRKHIGMRSNANKLTRKQFMKKCAIQALEKLTGEYVGDL